MPSHHIKYDDLKEKILADITELATNSINMNRIIEVVQQHLGNKSIDLIEQIKGTSKAIKQLENDKDELVKFLIRKVIDEDTFMDQKQKIENEISTF